MGKGFTNASIDWILSNPKYKGVYDNRRKKGRFNYYEQEVVRVDMPELAIVPPNLWQKVQKLPGVRKEAKLTYLLRGKIVCGNCGYSMSGSSYGGEKNYGGAYSCWNCRKRENKILRIGKDRNLCPRLPEVPDQGDRSGRHHRTREQEDRHPGTEREVLEARGGSRSDRDFHTKIGRILPRH